MVEQMVTCSSCSAQTPLVIEGFMGGKMFCPRCAEVTKAVLRGIGRCPHGRRVVVWPEIGESCADCAALAGDPNPTNSQRQSWQVR
jgi:hypothetical protein